jgi:hypothetical protein
MMFGETPKTSRLLDVSSMHEFSENVYILVYLTPLMKNAAVT